MTLKLYRLKMWQKPQTVAHKEPMARVKKDSGFSVLEALVAMAVLAGALLPLLALQGQFVTTTEALERNERRLATQELAIAHVSALNLDQLSEGELVTPYGQLQWRASPKFGPTPIRDVAGFRSRYDVTLYKIEINIAYNDGFQEQFDFESLGWHPNVAFLSTL